MQAVEVFADPFWLFAQAHERGAEHRAGAPATCRAVNDHTLALREAFQNALDLALDQRELCPVPRFASRSAFLLRCEPAVSSNDALLTAGTPRDAAASTKTRHGRALAPSQLNPTLNTIMIVASKCHLRWYSSTARSKSLA